MTRGSGYASRVGHTDRRTRTNYRDVLLLGGAEVVERVERMDLTQIDMDDLPGADDSQ